MYITKISDLVSINQQLSHNGHLEFVIEWAMLRNRYAIEFVGEKFTLKVETDDDVLVTAKISRQLVKQLADAKLLWFSDIQILEDETFVYIIKMEDL